MPHVRGGQQVRGPVGWGREMHVTGVVQAQSKLTTWILWLPNQCLTSEWFQLSIVALETVPGLPPANLHYPQAQYELMVRSLAPNALPLVLNTWRHNGRARVVRQFDGPSRKTATSWGKTLAEACVRGELLCETMWTLPGGDMKHVAEFLDKWTVKVNELLDGDRAGS